MTERILSPETMLAVLTHGRNYVRAAALLNEEWEPDQQPIYRDVLERQDVALARQLQRGGLLPGRVDLADYRSVNQLLIDHSQWFAVSARQELLRPFQE